jgi:hypothetical protein
MGKGIKEMLCSINSSIGECYFGTKLYIPALHCLILNHLLEKCRLHQACPKVWAWSIYPPAKCGYTECGHLNAWVLNGPGVMLLYGFDVAVPSLLLSESIGQVSKELLFVTIVKRMDR